MKKRQFNDENPNDDSIFVYLHLDKIRLAFFFFSKLAIVCCLFSLSCHGFDKAIAEMIKSLIINFCTCSSFIYFTSAFDKKNIQLQIKQPNIKQGILRCSNYFIDFC
jgi:hypothetical protein